MFPQSHVRHGTEARCKQPPDVSFMKNEECTGQGKRVLCVCARVCASESGDRTQERSAVCEGLGQGEIL